MIQLGGRHEDFLPLFAKRVHKNPKTIWPTGGAPPKFANLFFLNEEIFVQLDELDKLDRIIHA